MNDGAALGLVLDQVSKDKNIDRAVLVETLEQAILTAAKRAFGMHREMEAKFNEETGRVDLFQIIVIVETVTEAPTGASMNSLSTQPDASRPDVTSMRSKPASRTYGSVRSHKSLSSFLIGFVGRRFLQRVRAVFSSFRIG